jgi:hypothetical protein
LRVLLLNLRSLVLAQVKMVLITSPSVVLYSVAILAFTLVVSAPLLRRRRLTVKIARFIRM